LARIGKTLVDRLIGQHLEVFSDVEMSVGANLRHQHTDDFLGRIEPRDRAVRTAPDAGAAAERGRRGAAITVLLTVALLGSGLAGPCLAGAASNSPSGAGETQQPIDLNTASAEELSTIPGIGKTLAQRIVDFRDEHGPFSRVEDLMKVKGIGEKSFQKIRPFLKVSKKR